MDARSASTRRRHSPDAGGDRPGVDALVAASSIERSAEAVPIFDYPGREGMLRAPATACAGRRLAHPRADSVLGFCYQLLGAGCVLLFRGWRWPVDVVIFLISLLRRTRREDWRESPMGLCSSRGRSAQPSRAVSGLVASAVVGSRANQRSGCRVDGHRAAADPRRRCSARSATPCATHLLGACEPRHSA